MNVCNLEKGDLDELDMTVKSVLRREGFHGRQSSDERLYSNKQMDKGSMEKSNPERTNITEKGSRKSNEKGRSDCII